MDIIITTPASRSKAAAAEAEAAKRAGGGAYFRRFVRRPAGLRLYDRVYYVERGFIRGFALVWYCVEVKDGVRCDVTHEDWGPGFYVIMRADSWCWIEPIAMRGFQGYRHMPREIAARVKIVGGWQDSRPKAPGE